VDVTLYRLTSGKTRSCGCFNIECLKKRYYNKAIITIGEKFHKLTIKDIALDKQKYIAICKCDCGKITKVPITALKSEKIKSCGCLRKLLKQHNSAYKGGKYFYGGYTCCLKHKAKDRNIVYNLSTNDIDKQIEKQNCKCALSGQKLQFSLSSSKTDNQTASIDRINSLDYYHKCNIWIIHKNLNEMKNNLLVTNFIKYLYIIANPLQHHGMCNSCIEIKHGSSFKGIGNISAEYMYSIKYNANVRNISLYIDINFLWDLFLKQRGYCAITGLPLVLSTRKKEQTASLDRIDSSIGYAESNVQWVHKDVNCIKWDFSIVYLKQISKQVIDNISRSDYEHKNIVNINTVLNKEHPSE